MSFKYSLQSLSFPLIVIFVSGSSIASASSSWADLEYTVEDISSLDGPTLFARNRDYTIQGFENTPCRDGIFHRPSLWNETQAGTTISVHFATPSNSLYPVTCPNGRSCLASPSVSVNLRNSADLASWTEVPLQTCVRIFVRCDLIQFLLTFVHK